MRWIALIAAVVCLTVMLAPTASGQWVKGYSAKPSKMGPAASRAL